MILKAFSSFLIVFVHRSALMFQCRKSCLNLSGCGEHVHRQRDRVHVVVELMDVVDRLMVQDCESS